MTSWRREWDSNPRYGFPYTRFPSERLQPLGHPSGRASFEALEDALQAGSGRTWHSPIRGFRTLRLCAIERGPHARVSERVLVSARVKSTAMIRFVFRFI